MKWEKLLAKLNTHSKKGELCEDCYQKTACLAFFDERVDRDVCCPKCHRWNHQGLVCDRCGHVLRVKNIRIKKEKHDKEN
jgi:hypothetical protein